MIYITTPIYTPAVSSGEGCVEEAEDVTSDVELLKEVVNDAIGKTAERGIEDNIAGCTNFLPQLQSTISLT